MPHQCVRCNTIFESNSRELMTGCPCGSRVFLFLKTSTQAAPSTPESQASETLKEIAPEQVTALNAANAETHSITIETHATQVPAEKEKKLAWLEQELAFLTKDNTISIDAESVENLRVIEKGCYELDVPSLMQGNPLVVKNDKGIYYIKLPSK